jgi:hypothetical protein
VGIGVRVAVGIGVGTTAASGTALGDGVSVGKIGDGDGVTVGIGAGDGVSVGVGAVTVATAVTVGKDSVMGGLVGVAVAVGGSSVGMEVAGRDAAARRAMVGGGGGAARRASLRMRYAPMASAASNPSRSRSPVRENRRSPIVSAALTRWMPPLAGLPCS